MAASIAGLALTPCAISFASPRASTRCCSGEAEILGQLRTAYGQALEHGSTGPVLNRAFQGALEVGKRVRAETEVGARPMSVALAGVKLAERVFGNLKGHAALIVGAGARGRAGCRASSQSRHRQPARRQPLARTRRRTRRAHGRRSRRLGIARKRSQPRPTLSSRRSAAPALCSREKCSTAPLPRAAAGPSSSSISASRATSLRKPRASTISTSTTLTTSARSSSRISARAKPKSRAPKPSSPSTWRNSKPGAPASEASSIVDDLRGRFRKDREILLRERLAEMKDVSPEERQRLASITEELIERVLDEPAQRLRNGRGMRGRLGAIEAVRHLFGLDRRMREDAGKDKDRGDPAAHRNARQRARPLAGQPHRGARSRNSTASRPKSSASAPRATVCNPPPSRSQRSHRRRRRQGNLHQGT